ncbi:unnamed protein product [marine sediment metagenome]|uniref:Uncharacterized protein n=1 Tax=marine sediment metagenome TaxID=412755 RepID=X0WNE1_9ZZZZ
MSKPKTATPQTDLQKVMSGLDNIILAIKAKGGYKFRQRFQASDKELDLFLADCEGRLRMMVISLLVAEQMLQEPAPSAHPRWDEYEGRRKDVVEELKGYIDATKAP